MQKEKADYHYLNDVEKEELSKFVENKTLMNAVRKVILEPVYFQGDLRAGEAPDELHNFFLAQMTQPTIEGAPSEIYAVHAKSLVKAVQIVQSAFRNFDDFKKPLPETTPKKNRGR